MKIAVVTTTINVPHALRLLAAHDENAGVFVAGDIKTPPECEELVASLKSRSAFYFTPEHQRKLGYKCSDLLGWNTIARRNIALLEALKWGANIIVLWDDDNLPIDNLYFNHFKKIFTTPFNGLVASSGSGWFDAGTLLDPVASHRGFPTNLTVPSNPSFTHTVGATIEVAAGICLGDPDISAVTRIARAPIVHHASRLLDGGVVVDPNSTRTVWNSQNTAFVRRLAPAFLMVPQFGRYDDIFASIIVQQVMSGGVHFGNPFVWQQRNAHNLTRDLEAELWGMKHILNFFDAVINAQRRPEKSSVLDHVQDIYDHLHGAWLDLPQGVGRLADAWIEDVRSVL